MRMTIGLVCALSLLAGSSLQAQEAPQPVAAEAVTVLTMNDICCHGALDNLPPGHHRIMVMHPYTCCPVEVCFCLPCKCYCVKCGKGLCCEKVRFDIPGLFNDVVVKFCKNGCVTVK